MKILNRGGVIMEKINYLSPNYEVINKKDIPFSTVKNHGGVEETLKCDIYTPNDEDVVLRPTILWIHGGGFRPGSDKRQPYIVKLAIEMTKRGYVSVSTDYRVREDTSDRMGTFKDALKDVKEVFNWILLNSEQYGIDKNKIIIAGGSAGGMLAVSLCLKGIIEENDRKCITHLIDLWGTPNKLIIPDGIDQDYPKTIIVHGTADEMISFHYSEEFVEVLKSKNIPYAFYPITGAKHSPKEHLDDIITYISEYLLIK